MTVAGPPRLLRPSTTPAADGTTASITPSDAGWQYVGFAARRLEAGQDAVRAGEDCEVALVVLEGEVRVAAGSRRYAAVGSRKSVFEGQAAPVVLVAPGERLALEAIGPSLVAFATAPAGDVVATRLIEPADMRVESRGSGNTGRAVHHLLAPDAEAGRLILFEVITPGGNWSSYPPHKHDTEDPPRESYLEELYYYRFSDPRGFAVQRVYTPDRSLDETLTATDGDVVLVPRGYHPVAAAPGYACYYLNVMAGPTRLWHFTLDPDHAWLMDWST
jgi:5-deoxy-glucuronate isomerase